MEQIITVLLKNVPKDERNIEIDSCVAIKINLFCHSFFIAISKQIENNFLLNNTHFQNENETDFNSTAEKYPDR